MRSLEPVTSKLVLRGVLLLVNVILWQVVWIHPLLGRDWLEPRDQIEGLLLGAVELFLLLGPVVLIGAWGLVVPGTTRAQDVGMQMAPGLWVPHGLVVGCLVLCTFLELIELDDSLVVIVWLIQLDWRQDRRVRNPDDLSLQQVLLLTLELWVRVDLTL